MYAKTKRLELRPFRESDRNAGVRLLMDGQVKQTYMLPDFESEAKAEALFFRLMDLSQREDRYVAAISLNGELIGFLNDVEIEGSSIELGYVIHPDHWGRGYMTEALDAAIGELFRLGFRQVITGAFEDNLASIRVMEKCGMEKLPKTDAIDYRGKIHNCVYYRKRNVPKMVIFDAGRTLIDYLSVDTLPGVRALMPYITENPRNLTAEQIDMETNAVFERFEACRKQLFEVPAQTILRMVYDMLGLNFSISIPEMEAIIWWADPEIVTVPGTKEALADLRKMGVRTAVISNLDFSGYLLKERLDKLFPENQFEFVIASSDYGIRKPQTGLFDVGIAKSGLKPEEIWYVGDKLNVDVKGSQTAGMVPVLYRSARNAYSDVPRNLLTIDDMADLLVLIWG